MELCGCLWQIFYDALIAPPFYARTKSTPVGDGVPDVPPQIMAGTDSNTVGAAFRRPLLPALIYPS